MRAAIVHMLAIALIAVFAVGVPLSARADCLACEDCTVAAPAKGHAPCSQGTLVCQVAQSCAGQAQKMPAQFTVGAERTLGRAAFGEAAVSAIKPAYILPETAPPRL